MRFIYLAILLAMGSCSIPQRIRDLFDTVKEFAKESGKTVSTENSSAIIESAVRFVKQDGRQLDAYLEILQTVCGNDISKCDLDRIAWKTVERMLEQESVAQPANPPNVIEPSRSIESVPGIKKRPIDAASDSRHQQKRSREEYKQECIERLRNFKGAPNTLNLRVVKRVEVWNYIHYKMVVDGEYDQLLERLRWFGTQYFTIHEKAKAAFDAAYQKLTDPSFSMRPSLVSILEKQRIQLENELNQPAGQSRVLVKLGEVFRELSPDQELTPGIGYVAELAAKLLRMGKQGDFKSIETVIGLYDSTRVSGGRMRALLHPVYEYLKGIDAINITP